MVHLNDLSARKLVLSILKTDWIIIILNIELIVSRDTAHLFLEASDMLCVILDLNADLLKLSNE